MRREEKIPEQNRAKKGLSSTDQKAVHLLALHWVGHGIPVSRGDANINQGFKSLPAITHTHMHICTQAHTILRPILHAPNEQDLSSTVAPLCWVLEIPRQQLTRSQTVISSPGHKEQTRLL